MLAKRGGRPSVWEAEAIQDLFQSKTLRDSFKQSRFAEVMYKNLCEYMNEPHNDMSSKHVFHAVIVLYLNSCEGNFETKVTRGKIGGLSVQFVKYALKTAPDGTPLRSLLERAFDKHRFETGCAVVGC